MARKQPSKGKMVAMPVSPENYIRSGRARGLPIHECMALKGWEASGTTTVLISRKHVNGHITGAYFLVDSWCLGVKDSFSFFNLPEDEYEMEVKGRYEQMNIPLEVIDSDLAHSLIYGAVAFAGTYGLQPHKSFRNSRLVLVPEEEVRMQDLEFGKDGLPFYVAGSEHDSAKVDQVVATLERTAGHGNFGFMVTEEYPGEESEDEYDDQDYEDEFDEDDFEDEFDEDDIEDQEYQDEFDEEQRLIHEVFPPEELEAIIKGERTPNTIQAFYLMDGIYEKQFPGEMDAFDDDMTGLQEAMEAMTDTPEAILADPEEETAIVRHAQELMKDGKIAEAMAWIDQASRKAPHLLFPYQFRCLLTSWFDTPLPENTFDGFCSTFAGSPLAKLLKAYRQIILGKPEDGFDLIGRQSNILQAFPEKYGVFFEEEIAFFHVVLCAYFMGTGQVAQARMIAHELLYFGDSHDFNIIGCLHKLVPMLGDRAFETGEDAEP